MKFSSTLIKTFLFCALGLLLYLFVDNLNQVDYASTKNDHLAVFKKADIDKLNITDTEKIKLKADIDYRRQLALDNSQKATSRLVVIGLIMTFNLFVLFARDRQTEKNNVS